MVPQTVVLVPGACDPHGHGCEVLHRVRDTARGYPVAQPWFVAHRWRQFLHTQCHVHDGR